MHARHFLSGRGRPSSSAIQSNNCFITGPSRKSFVASIALACSGGKSVSRGGIYLFFLPDSFRDVLSLSIYHCSQKLQPSSHNSVFPPCRITEIRVLFCFRKRQKPAQGYRRNSYLSANAVMLMAMSLKRKQKAIKAAPIKKPLIRIAVVESDPLRFAGFHALFDSEPDFELISASLPDIGAQQNIDLVLLGNCHNLLDVMSCLKAPRPQLRIIVTGSGMDEQTILKAIAAGAKGYVDAAASPADFVQAIRIVSRGSVWVPRRVLSMFIERISNSPRRIFPTDQVAFTDRETQVLKMLVEGRSNKEIGTPLGIGERTVKAHVAKLMRKVGVENRVALTVHAITHSLVSLH